MSEVVKRMDTLDKKIDDKTSAATAELQQTVSVKFLQKSADFRESRILSTYYVPNIYFLKTICYRLLAIKTSILLASA